MSKVMEGGQMAEQIGDVLAARETRGSNVNVNVNEVKPKRNNVNVNNVRQTARDLERALDDHNDTSRKFFLKVAWNLPENIIWTNLETALKGHNPKSYFTFLCRLSLEGNDEN